MFRWIVRLWKSSRQRMWDEACLYDPEYDMWFKNHPLHPNYKPVKR